MEQSIGVERGAVLEEAPTSMLRLFEEHAAPVLVGDCLTFNLHDIV